MIDKTKTKVGADLQSGFTLIELIVAMAIGLIVLGAIGNMYVRYTNAITIQNVSADLQLSGRAAIEFMAREVRMAGFTQSSGDKSKFGVEEAQSNKIRFTRDVVDPGDPVAGVGKIADDEEEIITYYFDPGDNSLRRQLNESTSNMSQQPLIGGINGQIQVSRLDMTYLDEEDQIILSPNATLSLIRSVIITLTAEAPAGRAGMVERTFVSRVRCRNLGI